MSTIVAISRQLGSGGAFAGRAIAQRLGFQYADRDILAEAARTLQVETADLEALEERVKGFWEALALMFARGSVDTPHAPLMLPSVNESELFAVERQIIETIAARGDAVIVGRGAAHVLGGHAGVLLRIFLHAPLPARVARATETYGFRDQSGAAALVRRSDEQRAKFVRSLTGRDWCDASLYDLCLNTEAIGLDAAVEVMIDLVRRMRNASPQ